MRLSDACAPHLPTFVARSGYDRHAQCAGIVHLGIGAFHRAHQAVYTDAAMAAGDRDWAITGVSLRSRQVHDQLAPQNGLYTVTERRAEGDAMRLIGAVTRVLVAPDEPGRVVAALTAPATRIVTLTVTEKGYAPIEHGSAAVSGAVPTTIYDYLSKAVITRHDAGSAPLTLVSCDNLSNNGHVLHERLCARLDAISPRHRRWFEQAWACPSTMVDRIVPATTTTDLAAVEAALGQRDDGAVITEPYSQWVIEDRFAGGRPRWDVAGAQFVADVKPFETAKLRMLNGAHSALAYLGLARGHTFVHQAMADPQIEPIVTRLMREEAAPSIAATPDQQLGRYADLLLARFRNPALPHRLLQIAADGSQKIAARWLSTLADNRTSERQSPAILNVIAAWLAFVRGDQHQVDDPNEAVLADAWARAGSNGVVDVLFATPKLFERELTLTVHERSHVRQFLTSFL